MIEKRNKIKITLLLTVLLIQICFAQTNQFSHQDYKQLVKDWNKAHDTWQFNDLRKLYAPKVLFYCSWVTKDQCILDKASQKRPSKVFRQSISGPIKIKSLGENLTICSFIKSVREEKTLKDYRAYLVVKEIDGQLRIIAESDEITDRDRNFVLSASVFKTHENKKKPVNNKSDKEDSNVLLYSASSVALIAIIAFAARRRRRLKIEIETLKTSEPVTSTISSPETQSSAMAINTNLTHVKPVETEAEINAKKGFEFEKYIVQKFSKQYFSIKDWQGDKISDGRYAESNMDPDLIMRFTYDKKSILFAVECKYRSAFFNQQIEIATEEQLSRYRAFSKREGMDVYIALGIGNTPDKPRQVHLIPLSDINSNIISFENVNKLRDKAYSDFFYNRDLKLLT